MSNSSCLRTQLVLLQLLINSYAIHALVSSAKPPYSWLNNVKENLKFRDNTSVRTILAVGKNSTSPDLCFGFYNNGTAGTFFLVIMKVPDKAADFPPVLLWSANGNSPVKENATLVFTNAGLVLKDVDGRTVWSRGTSGMVSMTLRSNGNLRLTSDQKDPMWESFQEPTNTWLPGQHLLPTQDLYSSVSTYNLAKGLFHLKLKKDYASCYVDSRPKPYCSLLNKQHHLSFDFNIGSLNRSGKVLTYFARSQDFQYLRLEPNGDLSIFQFLDNKESFYFDLLYDQRPLFKNQDPLRKKKKTTLILSLIAAGILIFLLFAGVCYCCIVRKRKKHASVSVLEKEEEKSIICIPPVVKQFSLTDLRAITQDFGIQLGKGGYGEVFEGTLENGTKVAVKKLFDKGFVPEVETIGRIHHFNLVRLVGYCAQGLNRLLVYEYLPKGSLDKWIFNKTSLGWKIKWQIILGVAKGLEYLHEHCNPKIIHFDIKPQNILVDEEFNVKIADFGLAKWIDRDQSNVSATIKGTRGYMAPELIDGRNVSVKVDVYSFGIVILEVVTGRRNADMYKKDQYLIDEVKLKAEEGRLGDLIDNSMEGHGEATVKVMEIAIRCLQPQNVRPSMPVVVKLVEGMMDLEPITDYSFLTRFHDPTSHVMVNQSHTAPLDSVLSAPR